VAFGFTLSVEASSTPEMLQVGGKCKDWEDKPGRVKEKEQRFHQVCMYLLHLWNKSVETSAPYTSRSRGHLYTDLFCCEKMSSDIYAVFVSFPPKGTFCELGSL